MASRIIQIPEVGNVKLTKRASSKAIRISLAANGEIRVTSPKWVPMPMIVKFVISKRNWIAKNKKEQTLFKDNQLIGKSHQLRLIASKEVSNISSRIKDNQLNLKHPARLSASSPEVQDKARSLAVKALRLQAEDVLPDRLRDLAAQHQFEVKSIAIRNLKARWGSCNSKKEITLNLYLMLLPWELIDYVILHELSHTKAMDHGKDFWAVFEAVLPDAKQLRRQIRQFQPSF